MYNATINQSVEWKYITNRNTRPVSPTNIEMFLLAQVTDELWRPQQLLITLIVNYMIL